MSHLAHRTYDKGGMCYAACMEAFEWYYSYSYSELGGTVQYTGARKDATFQEEECQTIILGKDKLVY